MIKLVTFLIFFGLIQFIVGLTHILLLYNNYYPVLLRLCFIRQPNNEFWRTFGYEDADGIQEAYSICQDEWKWLSYAHLATWLIYSLIIIINILLVRRYSYRLKRNKLTTLNRLVHASTWEDKTITGYEDDVNDKQQKQQQQQQQHQQYDPSEEDDEYFFHYHHRNHEKQQHDYDSDTDSTKSPTSSSPTLLSPVTISSPICQPTKEEIEATEALANALYKQRQRLYEEITKSKHMESITSSGSKYLKSKRPSQFSIVYSSNDNDSQLLLKEKKDSNHNVIIDEEEKQSFLQKDHGYSQSRRSSKRYPKLSVKTQPTLPSMMEYPDEEENEVKIEEKERNEIIEKQQQQQQQQIDKVDKVDKVEDYKNEKGKEKEIIQVHQDVSLIGKDTIEYSDKVTPTSTFLSVSSPTSPLSSFSSYRKGSIYSSDEAAFPRKLSVYSDDAEVEESPNK
ncbi:unnamed protein product [Cunninghamella blakesleeana]